jgi:hypothetical protein
LGRIKFRLLKVRVPTKADSQGSNYAKLLLLSDFYYILISFLLGCPDYSHCDKWHLLNMHLDTALPPTPSPHQPVFQEYKNPMLFHAPLWQGPPEKENTEPPSLGRD